MKPFNLFYTLLLALPLLNAGNTWAATTHNELPDMGDPSATILSAEEDKRLGQAFMRNLRSRVTIIESPELNGYINSLGYRLLGGANSELPFTFFIVDDPSINAFAGPGGYIGIHTGLILAAESEGELAAVLAHEIAHVTQRHLARAFQKASTNNLQTAAAILAAIILGAPQVTEAAIALSTAGAIQQQLNFTREHEKEADRVGIDILASAGYDPEQMPSFFYRLQNSQRFMKSDLPELLRTHPVTPSRIADSKNRAAQYPSHSYKESDDFFLIKAMLHTLSDEKQHRMAELEAMKDKRSADLFETALWHLNSGDLEMAEQITHKLLAKAPEAPLFIGLQTKIELRRGQYQTAEQHLLEALKLYPNQPTLTVLYSETLLQLNKPQEATQQLRELIHQQGQFALPSYYKLLAKAEMAADEKSDAYQAMAEYYYQIGQTRVAIDQLKVALTHTPKDDNFRTQRLKAQLDLLQQETLEEELKD